MKISYAEVKSSLKLLSCVFPFFFIALSLQLYFSVEIFIEMIMLFVSTIITVDGTECMLFIVYALSSRIACKVQSSIENWIAYIIDTIVKIIGYLSPPKLLAIRTIRKVALLLYQSK